MPKKTAVKAEEVEEVAGDGAELDEVVTEDEVPATPAKKAAPGPKPIDFTELNNEGFACGIYGPDHLTLIPPDKGSDAERQYFYWLGLTKKSIFVPRRDEEPKGTLQTGSVNGLRFHVVKGVYVDVPAQVAEIIMESLNQQSAAGVDIRTVNPETGISHPANLAQASESTKRALGV